MTNFGPYVGPVSSFELPMHIGRRVKGKALDALQHDAAAVHGLMVGVQFLDHERGTAVTLRAEWAIPTLETTALVSAFAWEVLP